MNLRKLYQNYRKAYNRKRRETGKTPRWSEFLLPRLAQSLKDVSKAKDVEWGGPFGLCCECYIELYFDELQRSKPFCERSGLRFTLRCNNPVDTPEKISLGVVNYDINEGTFKPETIGSLNGMNHPSFPLSPDLEIRDIFTLMHKFEEKDLVEEKA